MCTHTCAVSKYLVCSGSERSWLLPKWVNERRAVGSMGVGSRERLLGMRGWKRVPVGAWGVRISITGLWSWPFSSWPGHSPALQGLGAFAVCNPWVTTVYPDTWLWECRVDVFLFNLKALSIWYAYFPQSPAFFFLSFCFASLHCTVALHIYADKSLDICDFFSKLTKLSFCHRSEKTVCSIFGYLSVIWFFFNIIC